MILISIFLGVLVLRNLMVSAGKDVNPDYQSEKSRAEAANLALPDVDISVNEITASGFDHPIQVTHAGDGSNRLFVVEQTGKVRILKNGSVLSTPFIDLGSLVVCCGERGLLGLAFHPDYTSNGYFFVNYTRAADGATVIARYTGLYRGSGYRRSNQRPDFAGHPSALHQPQWWSAALQSPGWLPVHRDGRWRQRGRPTRQWSGY